MLCEVYKVEDGWQCGNCGSIFDGKPAHCPFCGSVAQSYIDEGTWEQAAVYWYDLGFDYGYQAALDDMKDEERK